MASFRLITLVAAAASKTILEAFDNASLLIGAASALLLAVVALMTMAVTIKWAVAMLPAILLFVAGQSGARGDEWDHRHAGGTREVEKLAEKPAPGLNGMRGY